jgi:hypothetical protein
MIYYRKMNGGRNGGRIRPADAGGKEGQQFAVVRRSLTAAH